MDTETSWKFYLTPGEAMQAMYEACAAATRSIDFEQYIFEDNEQGQRFMDLFAQKVAAGVRIRFLCDGSGSYAAVGSKMLSDATAAGVQVRIFNPIKPWMLHMVSRWFLRNHRKLAIIDGQVGLVGGVNIRLYVKDRRDAHVRVVGPVVAEFSKAFERMWEMTGAGRRIFTFDQPATSGVFTLLTNSPRVHQRFTYWAYVRQLRAARKYIYVTTPYFIPDGRIFRALKGAARRGVDVRLMVPSSLDWRLVRFGNTSFYNRALRAGIKILEFGPEFNHAKTCAIDDVWGCVGSSNMDNLSLLFNYEADLSGTDPLFVSDLRNIFLQNAQQTKEVVWSQWRQRPFTHKILEQLLRPLHGFL